MEIQAKLNNLRISSRKVRLVAGIIRGVDAQQARNQLVHCTKSSAKPLLKLLESVIANATNNFRLNLDNLYVKTIFVDKAAFLKRFRPRAFGRAAPIKKHACHITIVLDEKVATKKEDNKSAEVKKEVLDVKSEVLKKETKSKKVKPTNK